MLTGYSRAYRTDTPKHPAGPSAPDRRRTCPPRTALSSGDWGATVVLWRSRTSPSETSVPDPPNCHPRSTADSGQGRPAPDSVPVVGPRRTGGVNGADISSAPTPHTYKKPQDSNERRGGTDDGIVNVSAVDTGPRDSCSTARHPPPGPHPTGSLRGARSGPGDRGPTSAPARAFSEPSPLHEGRDLLTKGCAHCTKAPPTRSTPAPPPVTPDPRVVPPGQASTAHNKEDHAPNH